MKIYFLACVVALHLFYPFVGKELWPAPNYRMFSKNMFEHEVQSYVTQAIDPNNNPVSLVDKKLYMGMASLLKAAHKKNDQSFIKKVLTRLLVRKIKRDPKFKDKQFAGIRLVKRTLTSKRGQVPIRFEDKTLYEWMDE